MTAFKKAAFILLLITVSFIIGGLSLRAFSQEKTDLSNVSLSTQDGLLNFFDSANGMVYMYSEATGRLVAMYKIQKLGQSLEKTEERRTIVYP
jgi:hypothetical protein